MYKDVNKGKQSTGPKHHKENQLLSLEHARWLSLIQYVQFM